MASYATKISANFVQSIGAELFQSAFMSLSISHWLVGFKSSMEKQRGRLGYISRNPSHKGGYSRYKPERICLSRVIVSATKPWMPSIGAEKVSFFSPSIMANDASKVEKEGTDI